MFMLDARLMSFADQRALLDAYNRPLVQMQKKMLSLHGTWLMSTPAVSRWNQIVQNKMCKEAFAVHY